jgi:hypothetical protein
MGPILKDNVLEGRGWLKTLRKLSKILEASFLAWERRSVREPKT